MAGTIITNEKNALTDDFENNVTQIKHTEESLSFVRFSSKFDEWTCCYCKTYLAQFTPHTNIQFKMSEQALINCNEEEEQKSSVREFHEVESSSISKHLKDGLKLINELRVWLPSNDNLFLELTMCCNYVMISIMSNVHRDSNATFSFLTDDFVSATLERVLKLASQNESKAFCDTNSNIETKLMKILEILKDPFKKLKLLSILGRVLILCSVWCLYRRQHNNEHTTKEAFHILVSIKELLPKSTMKERLLLQHNLILCKSVDDSSVEDCPCVDDIAKLVLAACHHMTDDTTLKCEQWEWLHTVCICQKYMEEKKYLLAMQRISATLNTTLDVWPRSELLCLMAECYLLEGHHQLALLTYREALKVNREKSNIFYQMAAIYQTLGLEDYELESLNLLVKILKDKYLRPCLPVNAFDQTVACVFNILPDVSLLSAMHHFAKRCFQLQKYNESAEQYMALLNFLKHSDLNSNVSNSVNSEVNVDQIVVETAEALVMSSKHTECISLCDKFFPCFIADSSLFNLSQNSDVLNASFDQTDNIDKTQTDIGKDLSITPEFVEKLCNISRKRLRSASLCTGADDIDDPQGLDVCISQTAAIRLLLAKADALVATEGFTDETMACLLKAYNLLSNSKMCVLKPDTEPAGDAVEQPVQKRRRLEEKLETPNNSKMTFSDETKDFCLCTWSQLMVALCLRMAKVSLKRKQYLSVVNCCQLILQLEPDNIHANYLRTLVLRDQKSSHKEQLSIKWLEGRGLNLNSSKQELQELIDVKQSEIRKLSSVRASSSHGWWLSGKDLALLSLDVTCLSDVINLPAK